MKTFTCTFTGCTRGAIGIHYPITATVQADDPEAARLKLYDDYDHITRFQAKEIGEALKLRERTTYRDGSGKQINIAGPARRDLDGKPCWWSIQGDHYTEDGLFVFSRRTSGNNGPLQLESFTLATSLKNLVSEDASAQARKWWDGIKT